MKNFPENVIISGRVEVCLNLVRSQDLRDKVIVDVGSSFGWLEKEIVKLDPKKLIGVEMDREALNFAKAQVKGAEFLEGSALELPLESNFADVVCFFDVLEHVPSGSELQVLNEIKRVLKKDGKLFFSTPNKNLFSNIFDIAWYFGHRHYSKEEIKKLLKKADFKIERIIIRGNILSSLYLTWFYIAKVILNNSQPRSAFFEKLDDLGYKGEGITDIFVIAKKLGSA